MENDNKENNEMTASAIRKKVTRQIQSNISQEIQDVLNKEKYYNIASDVFSNFGKIMFFLANILSFITAYTNDRTYSIIAGVVGMAGTLSLQFSTSTLNVSKSSHIKLNELLKYFNIDPVPDIIIDQSAPLQGSHPNSQPVLPPV